ncbi:MAG: hypothetical protein ABSG62_04950 [Terracidiphilus sp.]|jgi:hypothetical protein
MFIARAFYCFRPDGQSAISTGKVRILIANRKQLGCGSPLELNMVGDPGFEPSPAGSMSA